MSSGSRCALPPAWPHTPLASRRGSLTSLLLRCLSSLPLSSLPQLSPPAQLLATDTVLSLLLFVAPRSVQLPISSALSLGTTSLPTSSPYPSSTRLHRLPSSLSLTTNMGHCSSTEPSSASPPYLSYRHRLTGCRPHDTRSSARASRASPVKNQSVCSCLGHRRSPCAGTIRPDGE